MLTMHAHLLGCWLLLLNCRHSEEMIERLERAGLGYHVNAHETDDKLGKISQILLF